MPTPTTCSAPILGNAVPGNADNLRLFLVDSYYDVEVHGNRNKDAAWYYPDPKPAARQIKGYIAFWKGILVEK